MAITASKENPRTLERVRDQVRVRCTNQIEYVSLTSAHGYRDVTDEAEEQPQGSDPASTGTDVPPQSATKDVWVEHAVTRRNADRATAEGMTKPELITAYGA